MPSPTPRSIASNSVDPVVALRRIAYLLETDRAESYKVRAFRRAAATVSEMDPELLARRASSGRLTDLPGVGDTTARVIAEAVAGETPAYLRHLEEQERPTLTGRAAELRSLLRGDCHSHSDWSDGGSPIAEMAEAAAALGHEYLALTDHSPRLTVAHGLDAERLQRQLEVVETLNADLAPFRILSGIEVDILEDGSLDQDPALLARLDIVVASVHSKLKMEPAQMTRRMVAAIESPHTDILGHCTGRIVVGRGRPESRFDHAEVFDGVCPHRHRGRDQLAARAPRSARRTAASRHRGGVPGLDRHRRTRTRAARMAGERVREGGRRRGAARAHRQHLAPGAAPGVGVGTRPAG